MPPSPRRRRLEEKQKRQAFCDHQSERIHNISQLLRAYCLFEKDVQYVVEEGKVVIVDEFTGRKMTGRRWSDGLHGAVEAKEGVQIERETQTLATITIQNYFRLYYKLAGMTGTAETEANEFSDVYKLDVAVIPTNKPCVRKDMNDFIYKTRREKFNSVVKEIVTAHARQQPVLVGTVSVEASEVLSRMLKREKVPHAVLNAKYHMQEAEIISRAGQPGSVTILDQHGHGRGTDIKLGPGVHGKSAASTSSARSATNPGASTGSFADVARGKGDPRSLSRFYRQLRGRSHAQLPAHADRMTKMMERFGLEPKARSSNTCVAEQIRGNGAKARRATAVISTARKWSLDFDNVMNNQREIVYSFRNDAINSENPRPLIYEVIDEAIPAKVRQFLPDDGEDHNPAGLLHWINTTFPMGLTAEAAAFEKKTPEEVRAVSRRRAGEKEL